MAATLDTITGLLKNYYGNYIKEQQNLKPYLYDSVLGKSERRPVGNGFIFDTRVSGNMAGGPFNPDEALNRAQNQRTVQATINVKHYNQPVEVQNAAKDATQNDAGAFARVLDDELEGGLRDIRKTMGQDAYGTGNNVRTTVVTAGTLNIFEVAEAWMVRQNTIVDVYNATLTVRKATARRTTQSNLVANTLTLDGAAITVVVGDVFVQTGTVDNAPSDGKAIMGLGGLIDDGTFVNVLQNINRTTFPIWQASVVRLSPSVGVSNDLLQRVHDRTLFTTGEDDMIDCLLSSPLQRRNYLTITTPGKRFMDDNLDSGYKVMEWNGLPWMVDTDCQRDRIYYLDKSDVQRYVQREMGLDTTGGAELKWLQGFDVTFAYYICRENLGVERPNGHALIDDLLIPTY